MKNFKLILTASILCTIFLAILIIAPVFEKNRGTLAEQADFEVTTKTPLKAKDKPKEIEFDLKYERYLIPEPYTYDVNGETRTFQFEKMMEVLDEAEKAYEKGNLTYVDNYKNQNGMSPYYRGKPVDAAGTPRSAAAPGYMSKADLNEFIYIQDGTLVNVLSEEPDYMKISVVDTGKEYFVPSKYVRTEHYMTDLCKAIIVDRANQNIATLEKHFYGGNMGSTKKTKWKVTSYSRATTGMKGKYHQPTPLGYYYAIEKKPRFYYLKDGTNVVEGYAPYAVRFTAGAYVHGIATAYKYAEDGSRIDPGIHEYSESIGTIPLSHKCVRNYTSHAKFIYDWYVHGETVVIVIE